MPYAHLGIRGILILVWQPSSQLAECLESRVSLCECVARADVVIFTFLSRVQTALSVRRSSPSQAVLRLSIYLSQALVAPPGLVFSACYVVRGWIHSGCRKMEGPNITVAAFGLAPPPHWYYCSPGRCGVEIPE